MDLSMKTISDRKFISKTLVCVLCVLLATIANGKFYETCEIAVELDNSDVDELLGKEWICVTEKLSHGNSSAIKPDPSSTPDDSDECLPYFLGLFQITTAWCSSNKDDGLGVGTCSRNGCNMECSKLLDDDISDDIECLNTINNFQTKIWPQKAIHPCRSGSKSPQNNEWNYTKCLIDYRAEKRQRLTYIPLWLALLLVGIFGLVVFAITYLFYRRRRLKNNIIREFKYGQRKDVITMRSPSSLRMSILMNDNYISEPYNDAYEICPTEFNIEFGKCIGSGAYGVVFKATCKGKEVAAKTVKPAASKDYFQSLLGEIKILSQIGRHDFIVNMEGAYTKNITEGHVFVFMEYCGLGNLEKFLRSRKKNFVRYLSNQRLDDLELADLEENTNPKLEGDKDNPGTEFGANTITLKHLLQYAHQIAKGMEFLSSKQIIHSDLAARNILLVDENTAKISDFGLSRKLYGYINYIKKKEEPLPWRWMALESLKEMNFSTSSDVWMYGILLSEIFSLGEVPYPGLSWSLEFVDNLENGFRMLRPKHAPVNVYKDVMLKCWENCPTQRPSFSSLSQYFYNVLDKLTSKEYTQVVEVQKCCENHNTNNTMTLVNEYIQEHEIKLL